MRTFIFIAFCCGISLAQAQTAPRGEFGCTQALRICTSQRIDQLQALSRSLAAAASMKPRAGLSADERRKVDDYDTWLRAQSENASKLAAFGRNIKNEQFQIMSASFNLQYLQLQNKMQDESRRFTLLSNIMKTKHDTAKNAINNVR